MSEKCGCRIVEMPTLANSCGENIYIARHIEYCALHGAAEKLRDALQHCVQSMTIATQSKFGCLREAREALAATRGEI